MIRQIARWDRLAPLAGLGLLAIGLAFPVPAAISALFLMFIVGAAVHHAEHIALYVGEPFGTLILAVAVTVIEVGLILSIMLAGGAEATTLARDTVFAAVMIILNGLLGACLLVGGFSHREQRFQQAGVSATLAGISALTVLSLILPNYTTSAPGPVYAPLQMAFVGVVSFIIYGTFVMVQTIRHRDYFLVGGTDVEAGDPTMRPSGGSALLSLLFLLIALFAVVALAKGIAPAIEGTVARAGWPHAVVGVVIAAIVLLPEGIAAIRAALANRLQTSLNLALGSALASIGLTIPAVAMAAVWIGFPLTLGLDSKDLVLLALTFMVGSITLAHGRTSMMQGAVHLVIFAAFLFLALVP